MRSRKSPSKRPGPASGPAEPAQRLLRRYQFFTEFIDEFADAISGAGIFIRSDSPPPPGTTVEFEFKLGDEIVLLAGRGSVEWVREPEGENGEGEPAGLAAGMAVRFEKLATGGGKVIRRLVEANAQRGGERFRVGDDDEEAPESGSYDVAEPAAGSPAGEGKAEPAKDLQAALREAEAARQELGRRRSELAEARSGLEELTARLHASERELGAERASAAELELELEKARGELEEAGRRHDSLEQALAENKSQRKKVEQLQAAMAEGAGDIERLRRRFEATAENAKSLTEEVAKLTATRDELRAALDAREAEVAWLRTRAEGGGEEVAPPPVGPGRPLEEAAGLVADLKKELIEARETIAAIQDQALWTGGEAAARGSLAALDPGRPRRRGLRAALGASAVALAGVAIGALAVWQLAPASSAGRRAAQVAADGGPPAGAATAAPAPARVAESGPSGPETLEEGEEAAPAPTASVTPVAPSPEIEPTPEVVPATEVRPDPLEAVARWAASWSEQRVEDYLDAYSADFVPPQGMSRPDWEAQRRQRLLRPSFIRVGVEAPEVEALGPERTRVRFRQSYESEGFSDRVEKVLELGYEDGRWRIVAERAR